MNEQLKEAIIAHKFGEIDDAALMKAAVDGGVAANDSNVSFTVTNKGQNKGMLENGKLVPNGQTLIVDGKAFDSSIIPGINRIWLTCDSGIFYDFTIHVNGACPKSKFNILLKFTDESNDTYSLRIYSASCKDHYVNYHSSAGNIKKITWDI